MEIGLDLKYLFTAFYDDGTRLVQTRDNVSKTGGGSAYSDVDHSKLVYFQLEGADEFDGHVYGVNLRDGTFNIDGVPFRMHDSRRPPKDMKLVYFARSVIEMSADCKVQGMKVCYAIGWEAPGFAPAVLEID